MAEVSIAPDGTLTVDGKEITPEQAQAVVAQIPKAEADIKGFLSELRHSKNYSIKNLEKVLVWVAGIIAGSNGFSGLTLPNNVRETIVGAAAFVLGAIHLSSPTPS